MPQINVWKEYFNHVSLLLCIYINLTHTSRDPGWLNWEFDYQILSFYYWGPSGQATGDMRKCLIYLSKYIEV